MDEYLKGNSFDVILLDIEFKNNDEKQMNGIELGKRLRGLYANDNEIYTPQEHSGYVCLPHTFSRKLSHSPEVTYAFSRSKKERKKIDLIKRYYNYNICVLLCQSFVKEFY